MAKSQVASSRSGGGAIWPLSARVRRAGRSGWAVPVMADRRVPRRPPDPRRPAPRSPRRPPAAGPAHRPRRSRPARSLIAVRRGAMWQLLTASTQGLPGRPPAAWLFADPLLQRAVPAAVLTQAAYSPALVCIPRSCRFLLAASCLDPLRSSFDVAIAPRRRTGCGRGGPAQPGPGHGLVALLGPAPPGHAALGGRARHRARAAGRLSSQAAPRTCPHTASRGRAPCAGLPRRRCLAAASRLPGQVGLAWPGPEGGRDVRQVGAARSVVLARSAHTAGPCAAAGRRRPGVIAGHGVAPGP